MSYLQFDLLFLALPIALLARRGMPRRTLLAAAALIGVALVWTAPWDEHLVRTGVWSYDGARVLARLGSVPLEEYAFVALEVLLVAAWGTRTGRLAGPAPDRADRAARQDRAARAPGGRGGALAWSAVLVLGLALLVAGGQLRYLGLLLVWVAPPLALQRAVAGDLLRARALDRLVLALPVALWLCLADRLALADGIWVIAPSSSTGVLLLGLPLEEALFFALTALLVTDGLVLATDDRALERARRLVPRLRGRGTAPVVPSSHDGLVAGHARLRDARDPRGAGPRPDHGRGRGADLPDVHLRAVRGRRPPGLRVQP